MDNGIVIKPIFNEMSEAIIGLILPIQQDEFNVPVRKEDQPDLLDIEKYYHAGNGGFWGAFDGELLVGTIAMINIGHHACAVRKMFVRKEWRGKEKGIGQGLLNVLLEDCRKKGIVDIYLGTVELLKASHRFYEKNGFVRIPKVELPSYFPLMAVDTVFYALKGLPAGA